MQEHTLTAVMDENEASAKDENSNESVGEIASESEIERESEIKRKAAIEEIKKLILKRYGIVFNLETMEMEERPYEDINLIGHCREVSEKVLQVVGGEQIIKTVRGPEPKIIHSDVVIADGNTEANHAYVVSDGKVWDPVTDNWGTLDEVEYLNLLSITREEVPDFDQLGEPENSQQ